MRISDWSSDVCSSDLVARRAACDHVRQQGSHLPRPHRRHEPVEVGSCRRHRCENPRGRDGRSGPVPGPVSCWCSDCGNGSLDGAASDHLRFGKSDPRSEENTSELQSLMRTSYAVLCFKTNTKTTV